MIQYEVNDINLCLVNLDAIEVKGFANMEKLMIVKQILLERQREVKEKEAEEARDGSN
jgi:hypothetical protein